MTTISVIVGNPKPASRTRRIAEELAAGIAALTGAELLPTVDLIDHADELFRWPSEPLDALGEQLATSTLAVIATPTYKASYTGLLKAFLDRYPAQGLAGLVAIPVFTTASDEHALAVEFTLRPLLVELGASVPTRGLAFPTPRFDRRSEILDAWLATEGSALARAAGSSLPGNAPAAPKDPADPADPTESAGSADPAESAGSAGSAGSAPAGSAPSGSARQLSGAAA